MHRPAALLALALLASLSAGCLEEDRPAADDGETPPTTTTPALVCPASLPSLSLPVSVRTMVGSGRLAEGSGQDVAMDVTGLVPAGMPWECVRGLEARVAWTNTPTSGADLYVAVAVPASALSVVGHDEQQLVADGPHEESVLAPLGDAGHDAAGLSDGVIVTVRTDWASLSGLGVPATVTLRLLL